MTRSNLGNTTKKKSNRSANKNGDKQVTYSDNKKCKGMDRLESKDDFTNHTQANREMTECDQDTREDSIPMVRVKGQESESWARISNVYSKDLEISKLNSSKSMFCMQQKPSECKIKTASFGNDLSLREFIQVGRVKSPENQITPGKDRQSALKQRDRTKSNTRTQTTHFSPKRRLHLTMGSNNKLKAVTVRSRIQGLSEAERKQYLRDKLAAVMLGYKTRSIYHNNRIILSNLVFMASVQEMVLPVTDKNILLLKKIDLYPP